MSTERKQIPIFEDEDAEREFWAEADSTEYIDWAEAKERSFARLKPTERLHSAGRLSGRLPAHGRPKVGGPAG
ncbi:MAG TPA: CopG family antitoxin [Thermoanaerobaculia bacterium]|nr:CopG family antitoxin [Thermoanaerobaculia bacterium]